jgi:hypothetical protein
MDIHKKNYENQNEEEYWNTGILEEKRLIFQYSIIQFPVFFTLVMQLTFLNLRLEL